MGEVVYLRDYEPKQTAYPTVIKIIDGEEVAFTPVDDLSESQQAQFLRDRGVWQAEPEVPADVLTVLRCFALDAEDTATSEYVPPDDCA